MPYGGNPQPGTKDEVHLLVGDTNTSNQFLSDAECQYYIDNYGPGLIAAMYAALGLQAKFASKASVSVGDVSEQAGDLATHFADLAARLEQRMAAGVQPTFGGVDVAAMEQAREDNSQVQPAFDRDQFNNPRANAKTSPPFDEGGGL